MVFADQHSVEENVSRKLLIEALRVALTTLQTVDREIIELIYFRELSERETAARLGLSQKSVNRHKKQALKLLRELLADYQ